MTRRPIIGWWVGLRTAAKTALIALVVVVLAVGALGVRQARSQPAPLTQADVDRAVEQGIEQARETAQAAPPDAGVAYQTVFPSMVTITTTHRDAPTSTGAGVVVNDQGQVLTALHVVTSATSIRVRFTDGTAGAATVASSQSSQDIAVLDLEQLPALLVPAVIGGGTRVGDPVFAVGNPLGLSYSLTAGVVSGLDRSTEVPGGPELTGLIQFDVAVNPGSSGGPLVSPAGHVLGVVTGLATRPGSPSSAGSASPSRSAAPAAPAAPADPRTDHQKGLIL